MELFKRCAAWLKIDLSDNGATQSKIRTAEAAARLDDFSRKKAMSKGVTLMAVRNPRLSHLGRVRFVGKNVGTGMCVWVGGWVVGVVHYDANVPLLSTINFLR